jgi:hypothetical protein
MFFELLLMDLKGMFDDIRPHDFGPSFFWAMWIVLVIASLRGIDRRDEVAQITYMAFCSAFGVLFVLVFPIGRPKNYAPTEQIIIFSMLVLIPSIRWMMRRRVTDLDRRVAAVKAEIK